jgi:hypothetical protein
VSNSLEDSNDFDVESCDFVVALFFLPGLKIIVRGGAGGQDNNQLDCSCIQRR